MSGGFLPDGFFPPSRKVEPELKISPRDRSRPFKWQKIAAGPSAYTRRAATGRRLVSLNAFSLQIAAGLPASFTVPGKGRAEINLERAFGERPSGDRQPRQAFSGLKSFLPPECK